MIEERLTEQGKLRAGAERARETVERPAGMSCLVDLAVPESDGGSVITDLSPSPRDGAPGGHQMVLARNIPLYHPLKAESIVSVKARGGKVGEGGLGKRVEEKLQRG
ncbi:hypothetical protein ElyMa_003083000 [Elysia marginata]|uniref:Uncharacterized protein n=1 Tax=Elysia marginata TaxID=1093978 RepID=A0AAV4IMK1_9GAST|nr:hypothetical protein ElyMa_003083000 [Elysia marginata]